MSAAVLLAAAALAAPYAGFADRALVETPPGPVTVHDEPCPARSAAACVYPDGTIYIDPATTHRRLTFLHELGHLYDYRRLEETERASFRTMISAPPTEPWSTPAGWPTSPAERWAQTYAYCALDPTTPPARHRPAALYVARRDYAQACALATPPAARH